MQNSHTGAHIPLAPAAKQARKKLPDVAMSNEDDTDVPSSTGKTEHDKQIHRMGTKMSHILRLVDAFQETCPDMFALYGYDRYPPPF
jgi:hypothetical protein